MRAVVFKGPGKVAVEDRPIPTIQEPTDIVVKVDYTALCGSELHVFRGHQPSGTGFIMGHEFTGTVDEVGKDVKTVQKGDKIVSPFTVSCGQCFYCKKGFSSRCEKCLLLGCAALDGAQAEYVRVPLADSTVMKAPPDIEENKLVLMADIFPTGYFAAANAFSSLAKDDIADATVVVIGCGPVGLCALINAVDYKPKHLFAVDSIEDRLNLAKSLGAEPLNFQTDREGLDKRIKEVTEGRGADVVIEVVGLSPALKLGFDILRPWGIISSVGVHNGEASNQGYGKNLRVQMGRCPVRSIFPQALEALQRKQHLLGFMADKIMPLSDAVEGYDLFDKMKAQKVIFQAQK
ncbi:putative zinc-type alcohol dehydrogenase-like protein AdhB [Diplodia seriata]|uniref:Putative zinc-type alcohol dehydrogenase-like protein AdhB n=1 Tax=Diplodia seriata TaxID=420778 RepID=A0A1S8BHQ3_9PEZI|nr:putative zinc-type alcohol dehydrogenase-like protein AdhB [Diplodia seriata]